MSTTELCELADDRPTKLSSSSKKIIKPHIHYYVHPKNEDELSSDGSTVSGSKLKKEIPGYKFLQRKMLRRKRGLLNKSIALQKTEVFDTHCNESHLEKTETEDTHSIILSYSESQYSLIEAKFCKELGLEAPQDIATETTKPIIIPDDSVTDTTGVCDEEHSMLSLEVESVPRMPRILGMRYDNFLECTVYDVQVWKNEGYKMTLSLSKEDIISTYPQLLLEFYEEKLIDKEFQGMKLIKPSQLVRI